MKGTAILTEIENGMKTAFIDGNEDSSYEYRPRFISNDHANGKKVISSIEDELKKLKAGDEFLISVAFITEGGFNLLAQAFKDLEAKGIKGKILTTDYFTFSSPTALKKINELSNIEIRMYHANANSGFHTKGYIFKSGNIYTVIVGSSNITQPALTTNAEWNTKLISTIDGEYTRELLIEFNYFWQKADTLDDELIEAYANIYEKQKIIVREQNPISLQQATLSPNPMQVAFTVNLKKLVDKGEERALLISATGTGKTYASAFALRELASKKNYKRILFIVHREQIALQAKASYEKVFGNDYSYGILSGSSKNYDSDLIFSTVQTISKTLQTFTKDAFDVIVIDEVHRAGAKTHQKIIDYFTPKLVLGMTASPERTDGYDIFALFNHNIASEIRLQQALEEDYLCPFHYYGISDIQVNGEEITEKSDFADLVLDERVDHIIKQVEYFGYSGDRVKGIVFCSRKKEAKTLSEKFNNRGYRTIDLSGQNNQAVRTKAIERLVGPNDENALDYIFTVDIFNEGVDIPEINQVIMLRPTQSPIVFVQQLGRGLRKADGKEFVAVIDFIGNYNNNFMIPMALSGDRTYNKDNVRRYLLEGSRIIPGSSTIHFDEISKKKIFAAIDSANFSAIQLIKNAYNNLKNKLGRIPSLIDFDEYGEMDVQRIFDNNSLGSYHAFLKKYEKGYCVQFSLEKEEILEFVSKKLSSGKRIHELLLLKALLNPKHNLISLLRTLLKNEHNIILSNEAAKNVINVLTNEFPTSAGKKTYKKCIFIQEERYGNTIEYGISKDFENMLADKEFEKQFTEIVEFGIRRYYLNYSNRDGDMNFALYEKYTYEDVCRLLNWEHNEVSLNIGGYKYNQQTKTFPVFINYEKADDISATIQYRDRFVSDSSLIAISKSGRTVKSEDVKRFLDSKRDGIVVPLFVRKNKKDKGSKEFYYLGKMVPTGNAKEFIMDGTNSSAVEIEWKLEHPVREDIFDYLIS